MANSSSPAYSATKSGIEALTRSMAACWATHNVRVNSVAPGWIESNTYHSLTKDLSEYNYPKEFL